MAEARGDLNARADERLKAALEEAGVADPRDAYRARLRVLKERDASAFEEALRYYEDELVPRVADEDGDAVAEWVEYGRRLGELSGAGRTVVIDRSGRSRPYEAPPPPNRLVLHLPEDDAVPALALVVPRDPSPPQRATYELLVS